MFKRFKHYLKSLNAFRNLQTDACHHMHYQNVYIFFHILENNLVDDYKMIFKYFFNNKED